jgi:uncharacterized protein (UPF0548 family)
MFDNESFFHVGGSSPAPRIYTYETLDGRTVVGDEFKVMIKEDGTTSLVVDIFSVNLTFMEV